LHACGKLCSSSYSTSNTPANAANNVFLSSNQQTKQRKQRGRKGDGEKKGGRQANAFLIVLDTA